MNRARLAAGLALAALAGWWTAQARRERPGPPRLARWGVCDPCGHLARVHDPDLGCTAWLHQGVPCPCRRLGCLCPPGRD